jgi:hypothetical protein
MLSGNVITIQDFDYDYGPEGTIFLNTPRNITSVSKKDLHRYVRSTIQAIDIRNENHRLLLQALENGFIAKILGEKKSYHIEEELARLRSLSCFGIEHKILQRSLALMQYDLIDPVTVASINLPALYQDLHLPCPQLLPEIRKAGAGKFFSVKLFQDKERRMRIHIYPGERNPYSGLVINQDNIIHQHYADSASIVLTGEIVNQHYLVRETNDDNSDYFLYTVNPAHNPTDNPEKAMRSAKTLIRKARAAAERISNRTYKCGDHYQLPGIFYNDGSAYEFTDTLDYHKTGNRGLTVTLFTQKYFSGERKKTRDMSVMPKNTPLSFTEEYESRRIAQDAAIELVKSVNPVVLDSLKNVNAANTLLNRGYRGLFERRVQENGRRGVSSERSNGKVVRAEGIEPPTFSV